MPGKFHEQIVGLNGQSLQLHQQGRYEEALRCPTQASGSARQYLGERPIPRTRLIQ